jgi:hypothetical protein
MCSFYIANCPYEIEARSPIFNQLNIKTTDEIDDHCFSLSKMRLEIHKLKPEGLEETIIDKSTTHPRTNGPNKNQNGDWKKCQLQYAM